MKREIIFDIPDNQDYRLVCRIGYNPLTYYAWWCHIQMKVEYKKWWLFGETKTRWQEVDRGWFGFEIKSVKCLKIHALKFFNESILLIPRLHKQAIEIK